jgi:hypothetical protein
MRFGEMGGEVITRIEVKRFTGSDSPSVSAVETPTSPSRWSLEAIGESAVGKTKKMIN